MIPICAKHRNMKPLERFRIPHFCKQKQGISMEQTIFNKDICQSKKDFCMIFKHNFCDVIENISNGLQFSLTVWLLFPSCNVWIKDSSLTICSLVRWSSSSDCIIFFCCSSITFFKLLHSTLKLLASPFFCLKLNISSFKLVICSRRFIFSIFKLLTISLETKNTLHMLPQKPQKLSPWVFPRTFLVKLQSREHTIRREEGLLIGVNKIKDLKFCKSSFLQRL